MKQQTLRCALPILCATMLAGCRAQTDIQALQPPPIEVQVDDGASTADAESVETNNESNKKDDASASSDNSFSIASLQAASSTTQLITVATTNTTTTDATVSYYIKQSDGSWKNVFSVAGHVGVDGIGQASEYMSRTPVGLYHFSKAFGRNADPGSNIPYTQVDANDYWVDDPDSTYYNQFVSADNGEEAEWNSAEHILSAGDSYNYVLALDYNSACTPGAGSAMFLHCYAGVPSQGCITIPQEYMVQLLQNISSDCAIIIDTEENLSNY
ncbi:MAG: S-layer protein [Lachnospiraceae bacterium]|nr:S-layer protein [Lachnospiraceae bacterium]